MMWKSENILPKWEGIMHQKHCCGNMQLRFAAEHCCCLDCCPLCCSGANAQVWKIEDFLTKWEGIKHHIHCCGTLQLQLCSLALLLR
jgi:hypothetical protein